MRARQYVTVVALLACVTHSLPAQAAFTPKPFMSAALGFALQQGSTSAFRSTSGITGQLGLGYRWTRRFATQAELSGAAFAAPTEIASPCASTGCSPVGDVTEASVAANALILSGKEQGGHMTLGAGVRRLIRDPENKDSVDPFIQAGIGITIPVGMSDAWFLEVRFQRMLSGAHSPTFMIPFTFGRRF